MKDEVMRSTRGTLLLFIALACFATEGESPRVRALSSKMHCSCGCGEVLGECSHKQCERKPAMKKTLEAAIAQGKPDNQVLDQMAAVYGSQILLTPAFHGFNTLLWIVPIAGGVIAVGWIIFVQRRRKQV
jgi:cytochrome c-type biogenesis protein CcmH/NrfF